MQPTDSYVMGRLATAVAVVIVAHDFSPLVIGRIEEVFELDHEALHCAAVSRDTEPIPCPMGDVGCELPVIFSWFFVTHRLTPVSSRHRTKNLDV
jgi:hypothetical protein